MNPHVVIDYAAAEGAVLRMLGLVERRGFRVRSIAMSEEGEAGSLALRLQSDGLNRSLDVLALQLGRLHGVRQVSISRLDFPRCETAVETTGIIAAGSTLAQVATSPSPPRSKPIAGADAVAHESAIHQHASLQNSETCTLPRQESQRPARLWSLGKIDIRAPVSANAWPIARVELEHGERGRVTDLASAPGALDAAFAAVSRIMSIPALVDTLDMQYAAADPENADEPAGDRQGPEVLVEMTIAVEGEIFTGRARAPDILHCCVSAYIDAASNAEAVRRLRADNFKETPREVEAA